MRMNIHVWPLQEATQHLLHGNFVIVQRRT